MHIRSMILASAFALMVCPAGAQTATPETAQDLARILSNYTGKDALTNRIISVGPEGNAYRIKLDLRKIAEAFGIKIIRLDPFSILTSPRSDNLWSVESTTGPGMAFEIETKDGPLSFAVLTEGNSYKGIFDPKIAALSNESYRLASMHVTLQDPKSETDATYTDWASTSTGHADGADTASIDVHGTVQAFREKVVVKDAPDGKQLEVVTLSSGPMTMDSSGTAVKTHGFLDLWSFLVVHPSKEEIVRAQDGLRARMLALLPLWTTVGGKVSVKDVAMGIASMGTVKIRTVTQTARFSGIAADSRFGMALTFDGIDMPNFLGTPEAASIYPTSLGLDVEVGRIDLERLVKMLITRMDVTKEKLLDEAGEAELSRIIGEYEPKISIRPTHVRSGAYDVTASGELSIIKGKPVGTIIVTAARFEQTVKTLTSLAKGNPTLGAGGPFVMAAAGLAKYHPDGSAVWEITMTPNGVTINGMKAL